MAQGKSATLLGILILGIALYFGLNIRVWDAYSWWIGAVPGTKAETINVPDGRLISFWSDVQTAKDVQKYTTAHDEYGLKELQTTGKVFPVAGGTKVLILGPGLPYENVSGLWSPYVELRVLDGISAGKKGIVHKEVIKFH